jgi:hypothetical protein
MDEKPSFFKIIKSSSINDYDIKLFLISKFSRYIENEVLKIQIYLIKIKII